MRSSTMWLIVTAAWAFTGLGLDNSVIVLTSLGPLWMYRYRVHQELNKK